MGRYRKKLLQAYRLVNEAHGCLHALGELAEGLDLDDPDIDLCVALTPDDNPRGEPCHTARALDAIRGIRREILVAMGALAVADEPEEAKA